MRRELDDCSTDDTQTLGCSYYRHSRLEKLKAVGLGPVGNLALYTRHVMLWEAGSDTRDVTLWGQNGCNKYEVYFAKSVTARYRYRKTKKK